MIKVPKYIKKAIYTSAKYNAIAIENNNKVRDWMNKNNLLNDGNVDQLVDSTEIGNDPQGFIDFLENEAIEGNKKDYI